MYVVFDLETTGFSSASDDIIQFSYIKFNYDNSVIGAGTLYFYYEGMSWSEEAYAVHGISQEFLKQYKDDFRKNVIKMWTILSGANVCGHNSNHFDCPFARNWLARQGLDGLQFAIMNDTMLAFRPMTHTAKVSLVKLSEMNELTRDVVVNAARVWFGEDSDANRPHNATYDVAATALLTLTALRKGYMSFDTVVSVDYTQVDPSELLDTAPPIMVDFDLKEPDGSVTNYTLGGHKMGNSIKFPGEFEYVRSNTYANGPYTVNTQKGTLSMLIGGMEMVSGTDFDALDYTQRLVKGGN